MEKMFKYPLTAEVTDLQLPQGAIPLSCGMQGNTIVVWCKVDPAKPTTTRKMRIVPTGADIPEMCSAFIGTVQTAMGLVFHIFEECIA